MAGWAAIRARVKKKIGQLTFQDILDEKDNSLGAIMYDYSDFSDTISDSDTVYRWGSTTNNWQGVFGAGSTTY